MTAAKLDSCQERGEASSRTSARWAGWSKSRDGYDPGPTTPSPGGWSWVKEKKVKDRGIYGDWEEALKRIPNRKWRDFSWISARALLDSVNDKIAKLVFDVVNARRMRWIAAQRAAGVELEHPDFVVERPNWRRLLIIGDPGEADGSQYAVVDPLLAIDDERGSDFMLVLSDVIYPAGDINDYVNGFYIPYERYRKPILALPGNHDWYDGLNGFMFHFCGAEPMADIGYRGSSFTLPERIARWLWRRASRPERPKLREYRARRQARQDDRWYPPQPAPYFAMDMGPIRLVAIDTGIGGTIDREQGEWLSRVSRDAPERPKVLLTGKPIWVDSSYHPTPIEWDEGADGPEGYETVDDIVRDPRNGYVAAIGGDVHNYQRYTVTIESQAAPTGEEPATRRIEYIVSGGAGAYMSATHRFGKVSHTDREELLLPLARRKALKEEGYGSKKAEFKPPPSVQPIGEEQFRCYPVRGDSIAYYTRTFGTRVAFVAAALVVAAIAAGLLLWGFEDSFDRLGEPSVWQVLLCAGLTPVALAVSIWALGKGSRLFARRGYRTAASILIVPAALALAVLALNGLDDWDWIWKVAVVTLATVALPVVLIVLAYYGLGSYGALARQLATSALLVAIGFLYMPEDAYDSATEVIGVVAVAAIALALLTVVIAEIERIAKPQPPRLLTPGDEAEPTAAFEERIRGAVKWVITRPHLLVPLLIAAFALVVGLILGRFWESQAVQMSVVSIAAILALVEIAFWAIVIGNGGLAAFVGLWTGRIDPDAAIRHVETRYRAEETQAGRKPPGEVDKRTEAVCRFFLPPDANASGFKAFIKRQGYKGLEMVSEVGNADVPPMFKHFLYVAVTDDDVLEISCYGVTGWKAQQGGAGPVPREDCVQIDLTPSRGSAQEEPSDPSEPQSLVEQLVGVIEDATALLNRLRGLG